MDNQVSKEQEQERDYLKELQDITEAQLKESELTDELKAPLTLSLECTMLEARAQNLQMVKKVLDREGLSVADQAAYEGKIETLKKEKREKKSKMLAAMTDTLDNLSFKASMKLVDEMMKGQELKPVYQELVKGLSDEQKNKLNEIITSEKFQSTYDERLVYFFQRYIPYQFADGFAKIGGVPERVKPFMPFFEKYLGKDGLKIDWVKVTGRVKWLNDTALNIKFKEALVKNYASALVRGLGIGSIGESFANPEEEKAYIEEAEKDAFDILKEVTEAN